MTTRRTVVKGAAWATPVILTAAAAPVVAASVQCEPALTVQPGSYKCCSSGPAKSMYLRLQVTDANGCGIPASSSICLDNVRLANGQPITQIVGAGQCVRLGGVFNVVLLGVASCSVNLLVDLSVDGVARTVTLKSSNIPGGDATACGA